MALKRQESVFTPLPDGVKSLYVAEAKFTISKNKKTPGVNLRFKVNDMDENGQPQALAGRSFFTTYYLSEKAMGMYCAFLDALGFKTNESGDYLLPSGETMEDPTEEFQHDEVIPYLVGLTLVAETKHVSETFEKDDGSEGTSDKYNLKFLYDKVDQPDGTKKRVARTSVHPSKTGLYATGAPGASSVGSDAPPFGNPGTTPTDPTAKPGQPAF